MAPVHSFCGWSRGGRTGNGRGYWERPPCVKNVPCAGCYGTPWKFGRDNMWDVLVAITLNLGAKRKCYVCWLSFYVHILTACSLQPSYCTICALKLASVFYECTTKSSILPLQRLIALWFTSVRNTCLQSPGEDMVHKYFKSTFCSKDCLKWLLLDMFM